MAKRLGVVAIIVATAVLYLGTMREPSGSGGDYAMYMLHARNLATGAPYAETGYILNPHYPDLGPQSYPPGYPLLLAPVYLLRGLDLRAMRVQSTLLFVAFLPLYWILVRKRLAYWPALVGLLAVGLCPVFWAHRVHVGSDFAFLPFLYAALLLIDYRYGGKPHRVPWPLLAIVTAVVIWFASAVRSVGLTVIPALLLLDVLKNRRISGFAALVTAVTAALVLLQGVLFPGTGGYVSRLWPVEPAVVWYNATKYLTAATGVWSTGLSPALRITLFALTGLAAVWSLAGRFRRRVTILEVFIPFYVIALLVFPGSAARYLFPLIPLYVFYVLVTLEEAVPSATPRARRRALTVLTCAFLAVYGARYVTTERGPVEESARGAHAEELFRYIRESTDEGDVFVSRRPRVLALYTGRMASVYHPSSPDDLWSYIDDIGADYIVSGPEDSEDYSGFMRASDARLRPVYENPQFRLLEVGVAGSAPRSP